MSATSFVISSMEDVAHNRWETIDTKSFPGGHDNNEPTGSDMA